MEILNSRPVGDTRNFVHKRIFGAVKGGIGSILSGGNPLTGAARGFVTGGRTVTAPSIAVTRVVPGGRLFPAPIGAPAPRRSPFIGFAGGGCTPPAQLINGICQTPSPGIIPKFQRLLPGGETGFEPQFGNAVIGQFGAALEPAVRDSTTLLCPPGTVLGMDNLCYNRKDIRNSERKWPKGRAPLLTGGEMRCISIAASAAKKLQRKEKQLQSMGMLPKPRSSRRSPKAIAAGHHAHIAHD